MSRKRRRMKRQMALLFCAVDNIILSFSFMPYSVLFPVSSRMSCSQFCSLASGVIFEAVFDAQATPVQQHLYPLIWTQEFNPIVHQDDCHGKSLISTYHSCLQDVD